MEAVLLRIEGVIAMSLLVHRHYDARDLLIGPSIILHSGTIRYIRRLGIEWLSMSHNTLALPWSRSKECCLIDDS